MPVFMMLAGLPAAGKSTFAEDWIYEGYSFISSDQIRKELFGDEAIQKDTEKVFNLMKTRTKEALKDDINVIYDATNLTRKNRRRVLSDIGKIPCYKKCVLLVTPIDICKRRNSFRERKVPEYVYDKMLRSFQIPDKAEGWDKVSFEWYEGIFKHPLTGIGKLDEFSQDSKWHKESLGKHMKMARDYIIENRKIFEKNNHEINLLASTAKIHDIGKVFTKSFTNTKGELDENAHYYGHENYGAYTILSMYNWYKNTGKENPFTEKDWIYMAKLTNWHMRANLWDNNGMERKDRLFLGDDTYNDLKILSKADRESRVLQKEKKSEICTFIEEHPKDWRKLLEEKNIKTKDSGRLTIFNYSFDADFLDPIVQEARGIIIDTDKLEVKCWPFRKFGNYQESYADKIDWSTAQVQEKVDGSIIKLWNDGEKWRFSTNGMINASEAEAFELTGESFEDIIKESSNFPEIKKLIDDNKLNRNKTYIFELVSDKVPHVIKYKEPRLYHIGTRNNKTGQETDENIGIIKPQRYPLKNIDECLKAIAKLNPDYKEKGVKAEGFVVVDGNWNRIKIKSPEYLLMHHAMSNGVFSSKKIIEGVRENILSFDGLQNSFPEMSGIFNHYKEQMVKAENAIKDICEYADALKEEFGNDKKAIAIELKDRPYAAFGFEHLNKGLQAEDIIKNMDTHKYIKLIDKYEKNEEEIKTTNTAKRIKKHDDISR